MSLQVIGHLQKTIYELLNADPALKQAVQAIYLTKPQDAHYPFILVSMHHVQDVSKFTKNIYEVGFEISLFSRDKVHETVLHIANQISILLEEGALDLSEAYLVGLKRQSLEWVSGKDLGHNKVEIKYKCVIGGSDANA